MKYKLLALLCALALSSCSYSIPGGGQAVINDVTDAITALPTSERLAASPGSQSHASARAQQSNAFWGGKQ